MNSVDPKFPRRGDDVSRDPAAPEVSRDPADDTSHAPAHEPAHEPADNRGETQCASQVAARESAGLHVPSTRELFMGFLLLGLTGFGGVLPLARRMIVEERRWLGGDEFTELLGLCQFLPGGNIINLSVAVGLQFRGIPGAVAALLGLIAAPSAIVIGLGAIYQRFNDSYIQHMFGGLAAAAAGLLVATALKMAMPLRRKPLAIALAALFFVAMAVLRLPLLPTLAVLAPLSIFVSWRWIA
jgi:chromate transporter